VLRSTFLVFSALPLLALPANAASNPRVTVYRDKGCGCCEGWVAALKGAGYRVDLNDLYHSERLKRFAISEELSSCHTALVDKYLVEGHVPLGALAKLLRERPKTRGITLAGMPSGSPGMPGMKAPLNVVFLDAPTKTFYSE
jgi:hypothetical protein